MSDTKKTKNASVPAALEGTEAAPGMLENANIDNDFNFETSQEGEIFGGSYARLELNHGNVSCPLIYRKDTEIPLPDQDAEGNDTTKMQTVYVAETPKKELVSCPIASIFMKHFKEAKIKLGDEFRIKRYPDAIKKRGKGSGNKMQVYAVMVTKRAATES